jgi:hypothetical protein
MEIAGRQLEGHGADVLFEPVQFCGARDWNNPRLPGKQPRERNLGGCGLLPFRERRQPLDKREIRLAVLRREARNNVAKVGAVEGRVLVNFAREKTLAERAERNQTDPKRLECGQHFFFRLSPPQRIFALQRGDWLHGMSAADRLHAGLGKAEVPDFPFPNQILHGSRDVFDGHVRIDAMLIEEVDDLDLEPLQRCLRDFPYVRGATIKAGLFATFELESEFGRDDYLMAYGASASPKSSSFVNGP